MKSFYIGQRWISESEPELGLGIVVESQQKMVTILFPAAQMERRYGMQNAPLRRVRFQEGDEIRTKDGQSHVVMAVKEAANLVSYVVGEVEIGEIQLADTLSLRRPEERLFAGTVDSNSLFKMRYEVMVNARKLFLSPVRGFLGGRVAVIPHQFYVASEITKRQQPRVMLADEVGLGKTIEAGLILHQLILTGRASRVLILVPDSLVYQWFVEMLKKFQLSFRTINHETELEKGENPFAEGELFIASLRHIMRTPELKEHMENAEWDVVVIDEAHQLRWTPEQASDEYQLAKTLSEKTAGLILLSGTPEILGLAGHFARLHLLDGNRFHDYNAFIEETTHHQEISQAARLLGEKKNLTEKQKKIFAGLGLKVPESEEDRLTTIKELVDRHGTGRVYFRNTRKTMEKFAEFFPKRIHHAYPLELGKGKQAEKKLFQEKAQWLADFLASTKGDKTLLLCHDKDIVLALENEMKARSPAKVASFHSAMPLVHRDRAAAWFSDPEGAQLLLCTEIGSEGRNFEFAKHLVLFDLPKLPDLLEQRIGRLDRIGQKNDIHLHIPYQTESQEEVLYRWYHEGLNAFESSPRGASELYATVREELLHALENADDEKNLKALVKKTKQLHGEIEEKLEEGQDRLVELNSFHEASAMNLVHEMKTTDSSPELKDFMMMIFERLGVDVEDLDGQTWFVRPGDNMYLPHFPSLPNEGLAITFNRALALKRDDIHFLNWDHPMVTGIMEFVQSKEMGNVALAIWQGKALAPFLMEAYFVLECVADRKLEPQKWFPPTPIRVILDAKAQDLTTKIPKKQIDDLVADATQEKLASLKELPRDFVKASLKKAKEAAIPRAKQYKDKFKEEMLQKLGSEISRLKKLREVNPTVSMEEIMRLEASKIKLTKAMDAAELQLDAIRIII